jgi:hypothetical protein
MTILRVSGQSSGFVRIHQTPCKQGLYGRSRILSVPQRSAGFSPVLGLGERTVNEEKRSSARCAARGKEWREDEHGRRVCATCAPEGQDATPAEIARPGATSREFSASRGVA